MNISTNRELRVESGPQLLARLEFRPSLIGLDDVIFESGPHPYDITEISGDVSTGKTLLVTQLLAKCLLPKTYGGLDAGAILIDNDQTFQFLVLIEFMEKCIRGSGNSQLHKLDTDATEEIIKEALSNLILLRCYDNAQLITTFHGVEKILSNRNNISLIVMDSISAFYWENTMSIRGIRKMDTYLKKVLTCLQKRIQNSKVSIIYTKPSYFQSKVQFSNDRNYGKISRQIHLQRVLSGSNLFSAYISSNSGKKVVTYEIDHNGIKWHCTS